MRRIGGILALYVSAVVTACGGHDDPAAAVLPTSVATPKSALAQSGFRDCDEFRAYYARALSREYLEGSWFGVPCWGCEVGIAGPGAPSGAQAGFQDSALGAPPEAIQVSGTNTQEAGVDESDVIDADPGTGRFYVLRGYSGDELLAVKAVPAEEMAVNGRVTTGDHYASGLYLDPESHRLVVVSSLFGWMYWNGAAGQFSPGSTQLLFYDVSDPDQPRLTDRYEISGYLLGSRRVGKRIHLITSSTLGLPAALAQDASFFELVYRDYYAARQRGDEPETRRLAAQIRERVGEAVREADLGELLPSWRQGLDSVTAPVPLACADVLHPQVDERLGLVTISSLDTDASGLAQVAALNNAWQIYASPGFLYMSQWSGGWWFDPGQTQQTAIYRFRLDDTGPARPAGHGLVDGWLPGSYGLSEYAGALRAVTTESHYVRDQGWQRTNHLFVLDASDHGALDPVGQVRDFMRDESVFASRFIGDRGYVVTFRVVDPLLTFDLSDPAAPRLAGLLEVPGVSTYLHPFGDHQLLAIGRGTSPQGFWSGPVQLQLFDVADLAAPALLGKTLIGNEGEWAWSVAQYDPHAFTQFGDIVSVPAEISAADAAGAFSGFIAYRVAASGSFTELGRIDHKQPDDGTGAGCPPTTDGSSPPCETFAPVRFNAPLRSVVVNESSGRTVLYTLSNAFLKAHALGETAQEIGTLPLEAPP